MWKLHSFETEIDAQACNVLYIPYNLQEQFTKKK